MIPAFLNAYIESAYLGFQSEILVGQLVVCTPVYVITNYFGYYQQRIYCLMLIAIVNPHWFRFPSLCKPTLFIKGNCLTVSHKHMHMQPFIPTF